MYDCTYEDCIYTDETDKKENMMAREITDDEIKEWMQLLTEQETMEFFDGINMRAALLMHKLFPNNKFIWDMVLDKTYRK